MNKPLFIINSIAPIRVCDNGGWTDTWFAGHGRIFNIGVYPCAEVQISVYPFNQKDNRIVIEAENFGDRYAFAPEKHWDRHPLLEATIEHMKPPENLCLEITIYSDAPSGASTGTSSAVTVALIGALGALSSSPLSTYEVAIAAHHIETEMLGMQSGIQDQLCSAFGGINYIEMDKYPYASVSPIQIADTTWWELNKRLALVYLGKSHHSSEVHEMVIRSLENAGPECQKLSDLRSTALRSRNALYSDDFVALGNAMVDNTEAQRRLHPALISEEAEKIIEIAKAHGALGWKVNGAGGGGGSLTILCNSISRTKRSMLDAIQYENSHFKNIPICLSRHGLRVWKSGFEHGNQLNP